MKIYDLAAALISGILFLLLLLGLRWNPVIAIILAIGIYFALSLLLRPRKKIAGVDAELLENGVMICQRLEAPR